VALAVVVLPMGLDEPNEEHDFIGRRMLEISRRVGLPTLDPIEVFQAGVRRGEKLRVGNNDMHLSVTGHRALAQWLHEHLAASEGLPEWP
jgi:hypothetical protein